MKQTIATNELDYFLDELKIEAFNGTSYQLYAMMLSVEIFEDLFDGLYARIRLRDSVDLVSTFPIIGNEKVTIQFTKPLPTGEGFYPISKYEFRVFSVSDVAVVNSKTREYDINLVSAEFLNNEKNKVFKSWDNVSFSDIVEDIYKNHIRVSKPIKIEKTKGLYSITQGNRKPYQLCNLMASRAISDEATGGKPHGEGFFFFEGRKRFNFVSIGSLILQDPVKTFIRRIPNLSEKDLEADYRNILDIRFPDISPVVDSMKRGLFGSEAVTVDLIRQKFQKKEFKVTEEWKNFAKLDSQRFFRKDSEFVDQTKASRKLILTSSGQNEQEHLTNRDSNLKAEPLEDVLLKRTSKLLQLYQNRIYLSVPGDNRLEVGQTVMLELPESAGDVSQKRKEKLDEYRAGKYLITSLRHQITRSNYTTYMELTKDAFGSKIKHKDLIERYDEIK